MSRRATVWSAISATLAASVMVIVPLSHGTTSAAECPDKFLPLTSGLPGSQVTKRLPRWCRPATPTSTSTVQPTTTTTRTTTTTSSATTTAAPTTTNPPREGTAPLDLPRVPWEGGPAYYAKYPSTAAWAKPTHFPVGVWFESVIEQRDVDLDKGAGLNTYIELTTNSNMALIRNNGLHAAPSRPISGGGSETTAWLIDDEADMGYGPGWGAWNGGGWGSCNNCGYTVTKTKSDRLPNDGRPKYANYGKGVQFWETDTQAATFINQFQQFVSADIYWYTDPNVCSGFEGPVRVDGSGPVNPDTGKSDLTRSECRRAWNYGITMDRMRQLDGMDDKRQPIYAFVEVGHPFTENDAPTITGPQIKGAVMSSLIHEARGILYFNHSFGGACQSQHLLRDSCGAANRPSVVAVNKQIADLAPVLNTQSYQYSFGAGLDTMLKGYGGSYYVFAMQDEPTGGATRTFTLPPELNASSVSVLYENRGIPVSGGKFTDSFANEHSYHIYKITP